MPPGAELLLKSLPPWVQLAAYLGMFVVAVGAAAYGYVRAKAKPAATSTDLVLCVEELTDSKVLRRFLEILVGIQGSAEKSAELMAAIADILTKRDEFDEVEREVERRIAERRGQRGKREV